MDFHTHNLNAPAGQAIINLPAGALLHPDGFPLLGGHLYSAGIHPWWTDGENVEALFDGMQVLLNNPSVVAVGECGIDRLRGADLDRQIEWFRRQAQLSEKHHLPMTIHCVKAFDILLRLHKELHPEEKWTVHGFRGKPALARQLLDAGFDLSFGKHYNAESFSLTPPNRRHTETDENF